MIAIIFLFVDIIIIITYGLLIATILKLLSLTVKIKINFSFLWVLSSILILIVPMVYERYKLKQWSDFSRPYYNEHYGLTIIKELPHRTVGWGDSNEDNWDDGASMRVFPYTACLAKYRPIAVYDPPKNSKNSSQKPLDGIYGKWKELSLKSSDHKDCKIFQDQSKNKSELSYKVSTFNRFLADEKLQNMCVAIKTLDGKTDILFLEEEKSTQTLASNDRYEIHSRTTSLRNKLTNIVYSKFTYLYRRNKRKQFNFRKYLSIGRNIQGLPNIDILHDIFVGKRKKTNIESIHEKLKITPRRLNLKSLMLSYKPYDLNLMLSGKKNLPHRKTHITGHCN